MGPTFICGDIHLHNHRAFARPTDEVGINTRARTILDTMGALAELVEGAGGRLIQLGDFFDVPRPQPLLIQKAQEFAARTKMSYIVGNHDRGICTTDGALSPVRNAAVESYPISKFLKGAAEGFFVRSFGGNIWGIDWTPDPIDKVVEALMKHEEPSLLLLHAGLGKNPTSGIPAQVTATAHDVLRGQYRPPVVSGHWHRYWAQEDLMQLGALCPVSFADTGELYGRVLEVDKDGSRKVHVLPGPRFWQPEPGVTADYGPLDFVRATVAPANAPNVDVVTLKHGMPVAVDIPSAEDAIRVVASGVEVGNFTKEELIEGALNHWRSTLCEISK